MSVSKSLGKVEKIEVENDKKQDKKQVENVKLSENLSLSYSLRKPVKGDAKKLTPSSSNSKDEKRTELSFKNVFDVEN